MNRMKNSVLHIARFTLEARTALSIGTGGPDGVYDHPVVRDANGLPAIPGTSLAGVLRHLWIEAWDETSAQALFGYQRRDSGEASRLEVAACAIQDSAGRPVEGLLLDAQGEARLRNDPLLCAAHATLEDPLYRDRVRLNHRGVADGGGKFDRGLVPAGYRFSGELRLWSQHKEDPEWDALLALLAHPRLRLGGATRAGMGALKLVEIRGRSLDLRDPDDIAAFCGLGTGLGDLDGLKPVSPAPAPADVLRIRLTPQDFWRIGQGNAPLGGYGGREPDLLPKLEPAVRWKGNGADIETCLALAACRAFPAHDARALR